MRCSIAIGGPGPLLLLLLLLLLPLLVCGESVSAGQRAKRLTLSKRVKSIGCREKYKWKKVNICASESFRVAVAQEPNALVLLSRTSAAAAAWEKSGRRLQANSDQLILSTAALVAIENDLVIQGTLTIGNLTISENDTSALQGPPGKQAWCGEGRIEGEARQVWMPLKGCA